MSRETGNYIKDIIDKETIIGLSFRSPVTMPIAIVTIFAQAIYRFAVATWKTLNKLYE